MTFPFLCCVCLWGVHLVHHVLPVLDEGQRSPAAVRVLGEVERGGGSPQVQLPERLPDGHLGLGATVQVLLTPQRATDTSIKVIKHSETLSVKRHVASVHFRR